MYRAAIEMSHNEHVKQLFFPDSSHNAEVLLSWWIFRFKHHILLILVILSQRKGNNFLELDYFIMAVSNGNRRNLTANAMIQTTHLLYHPFTFTVYIYPSIPRSHHHSSFVVVSFIVGCVCVANENFQFLVSLNVPGKSSLLLWHSWLLHTLPLGVTRCVWISWSDSAGSIARSCNSAECVRPCLFAQLFIDFSFLCLFSTEFCTFLLVSWIFNCFECYSGVRRSYV